MQKCVHKPSNPSALSESVDFIRVAELDRGWAAAGDGDLEAVE